MSQPGIPLEKLDEASRVNHWAVLSALASGVFGQAGAHIALIGGVVSAALGVCVGIVRVMKTR